MSVSYRRNPNVVARVIAGETILVPVSGNLADMRRLFSLNETADAIWNMLDSSMTSEDVAKRIVEAYDVPAARAMEDTEGLLRELVSDGLVDETE